MAHGVSHEPASQVYCSRAPIPAANLCLCWRHSNTQKQVWLSLLGVPGSWCTQGFFWTLQEPLAGTWFDSKYNLLLLLSFWGFSFAFRHGVSFLVGSNILLSMAVQQVVAILEFSQKKMSQRPSTPPSCSILRHICRGEKVGPGSNDWAWLRMYSCHHRTFHVRCQ